MRGGTDWACSRHLVLDIWIPGSMRYSSGYCAY